MGSLYRYLVADVDDTFTVGGWLHPRVLEAVSRAAAAGIEVILNTGRPAGYGATLLAYLDGVSAVVVENGGAWLDRRAASAAGDPREVPVEFRMSPSADLRSRLERLAARVGARAGLRFVATADCGYRLTDYTVVRTLPGGDEGARLLAELREAVRVESDGAGALLASSIHLHFMLDGGFVRSKADGVAALLARRGLTHSAAEVVLASSAVAVGDSANDASLFEPGRFALSVGVRNIERYLPELGACRPQRLTRESEGLGLIELIDELVAGRLD